MAETSFDRLKDRAVLWYRLLSGKEEATTHGQLRNRRIGRGFISSVAQKGTGFAVSIISVPLAIGYLGNERYGLWMAVTSMVGWLALSDIGLGYSLTLALGQAYGKDDKEGARRAVSSGFYGLCIVSIALCVAFSMAAPFIPWDRIFRVHDPLARNEILPVIIITFVIFVINFPMSVVGRILGAYQEFVTANLILVCTNVLTLAALFLACRMRAGLPALVACYSGANVIVGGAATWWLFTRHKPWLFPEISTFDASYARKLMTQGVWFFIASMSAIINFQTDTLIISSFLNVSEVTPFSIAAKLFSYGALITGLVSGSLQPAYTEAMARQDFHWIKKTLFRHLTGSLAVTTLVSIGLFLFSSQIIALWTRGAVHPTFATLAWMAGWSWLQGNCLPLSACLNGIGKPVGMMIYGWSTALLNLALSIILVKKYGVAGVAAASCISFIIINIPCTLAEMNWRINNNIYE